MKIAISNIAWPIECDSAIAAALRSMSVSGIEIAPTKIWPSPLEATDDQIDQYRNFWNSHGISIIAAQALLFGQPSLGIFVSPGIRNRTLEYLCGIVRLCSRLGARSLVFGSPKNRRIESRDKTTAWIEAVEFFRELGSVAVKEGSVIAIEANPTEYGADFVTTVREAAELVKAVDHTGFQLHLDTACMILAGDNPDWIADATLPLPCHFHASEPGLAPLGSGGIDHRQFSVPLARSGYKGWISIEMRQVDPFDIGSIRKAVEFAQSAYLDVQG